MRSLLAASGVSAVVVLLLVLGLKEQDRVSPRESKPLEETLEMSRKAMDGPLTLTIKPINLPAWKEQKEALVGQPVRISLTLKNISDQKIETVAAQGLTFGSGLVKALIAAEDGPFKPYSSIDFVKASFALVFVPAIILEPGEHISAKEFIYYDLVRDDFPFPKPGRYRIKIIHGWPAKDVRYLESNVIEISIQAPTKQVDQEALKFIQENKLKPYLTPEGKGFPWDTEEERNQAIEKLRELRKQFPGSVYRRYVPFSLLALCTDGGSLVPSPPCRNWYIDLGEEVLLSMKAEGLFGEPGGLITLLRFHSQAEIPQGRLALFTKRVSGVGDRLLLYVLEPSPERGTILVGIREGEKLRLFTYKPGARVQELIAPEERQARFLGGPLTVEQWGSGFDFLATHAASELQGIASIPRGTEQPAMIFQLVPQAPGLEELRIAVEPIEWLLVGTAELAPEGAATRVLELSYLERQEVELPDEIFVPENLPSFDPARFGVR